MVDGIQKSNGAQQTSKQTTEPYGIYADRLNSTIPEHTTTVAEKQTAIDIKKKIMSHPDCPSETKIKLQQEINTIEAEIARINSMNSSVFDKQQGQKPEQSTNTQFFS